ncbi:MAG: type II toxin-antitoxin system Phd/YefM family antitoxin [Armatimonadetes bacterium]|nr:type II toxin-antitoxin system Phd/YefM family antitoxin [Armatimonadota bacterium]
MPDIGQDIYSLSNFKRNTPDFIQQLRETGRPVDLTINGKAELVVQDAQSYQRLLDLIDRLEAIEGIKRGLQDADAGRTKAMAQFDTEIREKHRIPR